MRTFLAWIVIFAVAAGRLAAEDPAARQLASEVITQAGGEATLPRLFRLREQVLVTATPTPPPAADAPGNRTSVVEAGGRWWVGKKQRSHETAHVLLWGWSLRVLLDPQSQLESLPEQNIAGGPVVGLRVTGATQAPLDIWFDVATKRLAAIDYLDARNLFSDWKSTAEGFQYPAHVAGYRFVDAAARITQEQQWYQTDLLEVTPLAELPEGLDP